MILRFSDQNGDDTVQVNEEGELISGHEEFRCRHVKL